jgi:oligosaccharide repeat unit polymerase
VNYLVTLLCFFGCLPLMFLYLHQYGTLLAPAALFTAIWLFTAGLYALDLVQYIPIDVTTWAMLVGSGLCFLLGCLVAHFFVGSDRIVRREAPRSDAEERRILWTLGVTVPLGLVGIAAYVVLVGNMVGYDAFVSRPYLVRDVQSNPAFQAAFRGPRFLNYLNILNVALGSYYLVRYRASRSAALVAGAVVVGFGTTLLAMDRTLPFAAITWGFFTAEAARGQGRSAREVLTRLGLVAAVSMGIFVGVAALLGKTLENNRDAAKYVVPTAYQPLVMPYIYVTGNIPAFQEFVRHTPAGSTQGLFLLLPVAKLMQSTVAPNVRIPEEVGDYYAIPFAFNTHTWLDVLWSDFGYVGVLFVPALLGLGATLLFLRAVARPSLRTATMCGLCSYVVINTVLVNKVVSTPLWEYTAVILVVSWGLERREDAAEALETEAQAT